MGFSRFAPKPRKHYLSLSDESSMDISVQLLKTGSHGSLDHRVFFTDNKFQHPFSPWHEIPLHTKNGLLSFVCTTPVGQWVRMESSPNEPFNPLRVVRNFCQVVESPKEEASFGRKSRVLPTTEEVGEGERGRERSSQERRRSGRISSSGDLDFRDLVERERTDRPSHYSDNAPWNMGCLPQTWTTSGLREGDSEREGGGASMLEVIEIGMCKLRKVGEVYLVKPLGAFRVEERGSGASWRIVAIAADDPMAEIFRDSKDVNFYLPGIWEQIRDWVKTSATSAKKGSRKSSVHVSKPCDLSLTKTKIVSSHECWRQMSPRQLAFRESITLRLPSPLTQEMLHATWDKHYLRSKNRDYSLSAVPISCPPGVSSTFWEPSWAEVQPSNDKILNEKTSAASGKFPQKGENSPPFRGLFMLWNRVIKSKSKASGRSKIVQNEPLMEIDDSFLAPSTHDLPLPTVNKINTIYSMDTYRSSFFEEETKFLDVPENVRRFCQTPGRPIVEEEEDENEELYSRLTRSNTEPMSRDDFHFNPYFASRTPLPAHYTPAVVFPRRGLRY